ncbi:ATP-dependent DNA helicase PIF1-like [Anthonomus grandis grandis]|uniref:ATP-dependent DNA helicase PIF1-like n=1 Tax=Anthonomus grandis grandis TaxID=2921223 RepID=UPI0021653823|nr:ATP-dependent DNA helicase PIF1-like [Anthonomus grandis grandis]
MDGMDFQSWLWNVDAAAGYSGTEKKRATDLDNPLRQDVTNELLEDLDLATLPPHALRLKVGCVVMLIVNLNVKRGLCNGQRMIVRDLQDDVLMCSIASGQCQGQKVALPRKEFVEDCESTGMPGNLSRKQFPIKLAHAITINKAQGQTLDMVGIYLGLPCFTYGQLYVALSRVRTKNSIKLSIVDGPKQGRPHKDCIKSNPIYTRNIVYSEFLEKGNYG